MVFVIMRYRISHTHSCGLMSFQNTRKSCFNFIGCTTPTIFHSLAGHRRSHWYFQFLTSILNGFLEFLIPRVNEIDTTQSSCVLQMEFSFDHFCFSFSLACFPIDFKSSGHRWSGLDVKLFPRQSPPGPQISVWKFLIQESKLSETCPRIRQVYWSIDIPIIIDAFLLFDIQICTSSSGYVNVFQWNREWFLSAS